MEIDEIAARLLRQYWALVLLCVAVPLVGITLMVTKQPPMYAASARIVSLGARSRPATRRRKPSSARSRASPPARPPRRPH